MTWAEREREFLAFTGCLFCVILLFLRPSLVYAVQILQLWQLLQFWNQVFALHTELIHHDSEKNNTCYLSSESYFIVISDHWIVLFLVFLEVNYSESLKDTVSHFKFDIGDVHQPIITCHVLDVGGIAYEIHFIQSNKWIWEYMMSGY